MNSRISRNLNDWAVQLSRNAWGSIIIVPQKKKLGTIATHAILIFLTINLFMVQITAPFFAISIFLMCKIPTPPPPFHLFRFYRSGCLQLVLQIRKCVFASLSPYLPPFPFSPAATLRPFSLFTFLSRRLASPFEIPPGRCSSSRSQIK